MSNLATADGAN